MSLFLDEETDTENVQEEDEISSDSMSQNI